MKFSSQEEYGLRCLLRIAREGRATGLTIPEISEAEGISTFYVAKLMRVLRRGGLVKSSRGKIGGYALARPPSEITVKEIVEHLDGPLEMPRTILKDKTLKSYLLDRQKVIGSSFDQTLEDLVAERKRQNECIVYHI